MDTDIHRRALPMKTQRSSGGRLYDNWSGVWSDAVVEAKERRRLLAIERSGNRPEQFFSRAFRGSLTLSILDTRLPVFKTMRIILVLNHLLYNTLSRQPCGSCCTGSGQVVSSLEGSTSAVLLITRQAFGLEKKREWLSLEWWSVDVCQACDQFMAKS